MKILVTGATGRIGRSLVKRLEATHKLVLLSKSPAPGIGSLYQINLTDRRALSKLIKDEKLEAIIHLAGLLAPACEANPGLAQQINVEATEFLAKVAQENNVKTFIFASSSGVYNQTELSPTDEFHNVEPLSVYGETKLQAENKLELLAAKSDTKIISLRLFNIYGTDFTDSLISKLLESRADKPATLYGPDNFYRDYIHISDIASAFEEMLNTNGNNYEVYNIGSGEVLSNSQLVTELDKAGAKVYFNVKKCQNSISWADIARVTKATNWQPTFKFKEFVKELNNDARRTKN